MKYLKQFWNSLENESIGEKMVKFFNKNPGIIWVLLATLFILHGYLKSKGINFLSS